MSEDRIKLRWLKYVVRGEGKNRSDAYERFSYRENVLFSHNYPVARLVQAPGRNWICVTRTGTRPYNPEKWEKDGKPKMIDYAIAPCIGAFTHYPGDQISDAELHERVRHLWHLEANYVIEQAETWPTDKLLVRTAGSYRQEGAISLVNDMSRIGKQHDRYRNLFGLTWLNFPDHYTETLDSIISARRKEYEDPKAVAARERQVARKHAKEALGV